MNSYFITTIFPLTGAVFMFVLGTVVFLKKSKTNIGIVFALFCFSVVNWLFSTFMMYLSKTEEQIIFWDRIVYAGVVFIPVLMFHFGLIFTRTAKRKLLWSGYILSFIFLILSRTDYFVADLYKYDWGYHTQAKLFHTAFLIFFLVYVFLFFSVIFQYYRRAYGVGREQTKYLFAAFIILNIGAVAYLPAYGIDFYPIVAYLAEIMGALIIAYAIIRYRLMDIRFILGRGAVYVLSTSAIVALAFFLAFLNSRFLGNIPFNFAGPAILIICILFSRNVFQFFEKFASKYFYYTFYSTQTVLADLGRRLTRVLDIDELSSLIIGTLIDTMKIDKVAIFIKQNGSGLYEVQKNIGFDEEVGLSLTKDNFLISYLERTQAPLVYDEISFILREAGGSAGKGNLQQIKENMKKIDAGLCLPLVSENKIFGMILLGCKISKDPYSSHDIDLLDNLSNQASITLQNAKLYSETKGFNVKLESEVEKRTRELKNAYEELQKLDKAKSEFLSIASHQLRTPLTAIKGYISMILENTFGEPGAKMQKPLENIYTSNERLIKLVNDLLNVSRIEAGRLEMKPEETDVAEMILSILEELKPAVQMKKIYLKFEKMEKPLPKILIDADKIRQALMNVVDNAIRYTQKGGINIKTSLRKNFYQIKITDTGEGILKEDIVDLFDSFSRGKAGNKLWTEGMGLGLYVAKKFVDLHKGRIWAESKGKGKGSTFFVELPLK